MNNTRYISESISISTPPLKYSSLKTLLTQYLPAIDTSLDTGGEILDCAYVRYAVQSVLAKHSDSEQLDTNALKALIDMLALRFEYIPDTALLYTENTTSPVNQFCMALATKLQRATGINRFQLLMPSLESTESLTGMDINDDDVAITDFILSDDQTSFIDIDACFAASVNDCILRHTNQNKTLSSSEQDRLLKHSQENRDYYDAIKKRYEFKRNGATLGAFLQNLVDGLDKGSVSNNGEEENAGVAANEAIACFARVYNSLPIKRKNWLNSLSASDQPFGKIWHVLTVQQFKTINKINNIPTHADLAHPNNDLALFNNDFKLFNNDSTIPYDGPILSKEEKEEKLKRVHLAINTCAQINYGKIKNILNQHKQALFAIPINNQIIQENNIALYDEAVSNSKHWFITRLLQLRQNKIRLTKLVYKKPDDALIKAILSNMSRRFLVNLIKQLCTPPQVKIFAGWDQTFILTNAGKLYACGENNWGQLGLGDKTSRKTFTEVTNIPGNIIQVIAGHGHTFLLAGAGELYACGGNYEGQLGLYNSTTNTFIRVPNIPGNIIQVTTGDLHAFILTDAGKLHGCGQNNWGQLGLRDETHRNTFTEITNIPDNITQIIGGSFHTFILTNTDKLYACGSNRFGQLGLGDETNRNTFTEITNIPDNITQVIAGVSHTFILTETGKLYACGLNCYGQLGLNDNTNRNTFTEITNIPCNIIKIIAGGYHTFILTDTGKLYACGQNNCGQLGLGDETSRKTFTEVTNIPGNIITVIAGGYHTCILTDTGKLYTCGYNCGGQPGLGDDTSRFTFTEVRIPIPVNHIKLAQQLEEYLTPTSFLSSSFLFAESRETTPPASPSTGLTRR